MTQISVSPALSTVAPGATIAFTATVTGLADASVTWSVREAAGGSITTAGVYTAPDAGGPFHIVATSTAAPSVSGEAVVWVTAAVGTCDNLPPPGVWERVSPPGGDWYSPPLVEDDDFWHNRIDAPVLRPDNQRIYVSVRHAGEYYSDDCGASWHHASGMPDADLGGDHPDRDGVSGRLFLDREHPDVMYKHNFQGRIWRSQDAGRTWTEWGPVDLYHYFLFGFINWLHLDPTDTQHFVISSHTVCVDHDRDGNTDEENDTWACLIETDDGGASWHLIEAAVSWSEGSGVAMLDHDNWLFGTGTIGAGLYQTFDGGETWVTQRPEEAGGYYPVVYRSASGRYFTTSVHEGVLASDDGHTWTAIPDSPHNTPQIYGTGRLMFTSDQWHREGLSVATEADPTDWRPFDPQPPEESAPCMDNGCGNTNDVGGSVIYDPIHRVLYLARQYAGLWRIVLPE